nr:hypothetical protein [Nocardioides sp. J54]
MGVLQLLDRTPGGAGAVQARSPAVGGLGTRQQGVRRRRDGDRLLDEVQLVRSTRLEARAAEQRGGQRPRCSRATGQRQLLVREPERLVLSPEAVGRCGGREPPGHEGVVGDAVVGEPVPRGVGVGQRLLVVALGQGEERPVVHDDAEGVAVRVGPLAQLDRPAGSFEVAAQPPGAGEDPGTPREGRRDRGLGQLDGAGALALGLLEGAPLQGHDGRGKGCGPEGVDRPPGLGRRTRPGGDVAGEVEAVHRHQCEGRPDRSEAEARDPVEWSVRHRGLDQAPYVGAAPPHAGEHVGDLDRQPGAGRHLAGEVLLREPGRQILRLAPDRRVDGPGAVAPGGDVLGEQVEGERVVVRDELPGLAGDPGCCGVVLVHELQSGEVPHQLDPLARVRHEGEGLLQPVARGGVAGCRLGARQLEHHGRVVVAGHLEQRPAQERHGAVRSSGAHRGRRGAAQDRHHLRVPAGWHRQQVRRHPLVGSAARAQQRRGVAVQLCAQHGRHVALHGRGDELVPERQGLPVSEEAFVHERHHHLHGVARRQAGERRDVVEEGVRAEDGDGVGEPPRRLPEAAQPGRHRPQHGVGDELPDPVDRACRVGREALGAQRRQQLAHHERVAAGDVAARRGELLRRAPEVRAHQLADRLGSQRWRLDHPRTRIRRQPADQVPVAVVGVEPVRQGDDHAHVLEPEGEAGERAQAGTVAGLDVVHRQQHAAGVLGRQVVHEPRDALDHGRRRLLARGGARGIRGEERAARCSRSGEQARAGLRVGRVDQAAEQLPRRTEREVLLEVRPAR